MEELEIIQSWKNLVKGKFYLIRYLKKHAIFFDVSDHPCAYIGFSNVWFAILEGIVVISGLTRDGVEQILQEIIPAEKRELVYVFHLHK